MDQYRKKILIRFLSVALSLAIVLGNSDNSYAAVKVRCWTGCLQVQSLIEAVSSSADESFSQKARLEIKFILEMLNARAGEHIYNINAVMDEWYSSAGLDKKGRIFDLAAGPDGNIVIRLFRGNRRGSKVAILTYEKGRGYSLMPLSADGGPADALPLPPYPGMGDTTSLVRIDKKNGSFFLKGEKRTEIEIPMRYEGLLDAKRLVDSIIPYVEPSESDLVTDMLKPLCERPVEVCSFSGPSVKVLAFASAGHNIIACRDELANEPLALFHEALELLADEAALDLSVRTGTGKLIVRTKGKKRVLDVRATLEALRREGEEWASWQAKAFNAAKNRHYLIRLLQRRLMPEADTLLTGRVSSRDEKVPVPVERGPYAGDAERAFIRKGAVPDRGTGIYTGKDINVERPAGGESYATVNNINALYAEARKLGKKEFVVRNFQLALRQGSFKFLGTTYWTSLKGYEGALVNVRFKGGVPVEVVDQRGRKLYPFTRFLVYENAGIEAGRRVGGKYRGGAHERNGLNILLKKYPDCVAEKVQLNNKGAFIHDGKLFLGEEPSRSSAFCTVRYSGGDPVEIFTEKGVRLYPVSVDSGGDIRIYDLSSGEKGKHIISIRDKSSIPSLLSEYRDCIVEGYTLNSQGGLFFNNRIYWHTFAGRSGEPVRLVVRGGALDEVTGSDGERIYPFHEDKMICVYAGAEVDDGRRKKGSGRLIGKVRHSRKVGELLEDRGERDIVLENYPLTSIGGCVYGNEVIWQKRSGYERLRVTLVVRDGRLFEVYGPEGERLFPFGENLIYVGGYADHRGRRKGGRMVHSSASAKTLSSAHGLYPDCIIERFRLTALGGMNFGGETFWKKKKGYENALVTIVKQAGEVVAIYDEQGRNIYPSRRAAVKIFNRLWEKGEVYNLLTLFGEEGTAKIMLRFFDGFTLANVLEQIRNFKKVRGVRGGEASQASGGEMFERINRISIFDKKYRKTDEVEALAQEIIRMIYPRVVNDHRFLAKIKKESNRKENSPFLRSAYARVLSYYTRGVSQKIKGINPTTSLKFYQKMGIHYILKKKKVILADEPGLGKTVQALGACMNAYEGRSAEKTLIFCSHVSKMNIWRKQIKEHIRGDHRVFVINDIAALEKKKNRRKAAEAKFIIVNYELIRGRNAAGLREAIKDLKPDFIIADEGHRIRNDTQTFRAVNEFQADYKVIVTGTPVIGRRYSSVYNLMHWLYPEKYPSRREFLEVFRKGSDGTGKLKYALSDLMLRRHLGDVLSEMPELEVTVIPLNMKEEQARLYRRMVANIVNDKTAPVIARLDLLKKAAIDSSLVPLVKFTDIETGEITEPEPGRLTLKLNGRSCFLDMQNTVSPKLSYADAGGNIVTKTLSSGALADVIGKMFKVDICVRERSSAKIEKLDELAEEFIERKRQKMAVFSGSLCCVHDLARRYRKKGYQVYTVHGGIRGDKREEQIKGFNRNKGPCMIICTYQSGGESIDLTGASCGVLIDQPWTIQQQNQIIRRVYRLKQKEKVSFYILHSYKSIDDRIAEILAESEIKEKLLLDDPEWLFNKQKKIVREFLKKRFDDKKDAESLERFRDIKNKRYGHEDHGEGAAQGPLEKISFEIRDPEGRRSRVEGFSDLINNVSELSEEAKGSLRRMFIRRFKQEALRSVRVKDMLLWKVLNDTVPGFSDIDFHGRLEFLIEIASYILRRLIEDPGINEEDLMKELGDMPENLYNEAIYYLDRMNIFKLLSVTGVLEKNYYVRGGLLEYNHPIMVYFDGNTVNYYDQEIVESIAPRIRKPARTGEKYPGSYENMARSYRDLTREEEIRLARQMESGNKAAETALISCNLRKVLHMKRSMRKWLISIFGSSVKDLLDEDDIYSAAKPVLIEYIRRYAFLGAYEYYDLDEYLKSRLMPRIYSEGITLVKEKMNRSLDADPYDPGRNGNSDRVKENGRSSYGAETDREMSVRQTLGVMLSGKGFSEEEAQCIIKFVFDGYTLRGLVEWYAEEFPGSDMTEEKAGALVARFREAMSGMGRENIVNILRDGDDKGESQRASIAEDRDKRACEDIISRACYVSSGVLGEISRAAGSAPEIFAERPVDIVIDLSLLHKEDLDENMETWASLILSCESMKNVNFIFSRPDPFGDGSSPRELKEDLKNAPTEEQIDNCLVHHLVKVSMRKGMGHIDVDNLASARINTAPRTGSIKVPLISEKWLAWVRQRYQAGDADVENVMEGQYPVCMQELTYIEGKGMAVRNFPAALSIGLVQAYLVLAREKEDDEGFRHLRDRLREKVEDIYCGIRKDIKDGDIDALLLDRMISPAASARLNLALKLSIPKILRKSISEIRKFHDTLQLFLYNV